MDTVHTDPTNDSTTSPLQQVREELISQGAEGRLYSTIYEGKPCIVKERFKKEYRHPILDEKITRERLNIESRCITRCRVKAGLDSPLVYTIDTIRSRIYMEYITGCTVKIYLYRLQQQLYDIEDQIKYYQQQQQQEQADPQISSSSSSSTSLRLQFYQNLYEQEQKEQEKDYAYLAMIIGTSIAKLHMDGNIIHGDLTTSNMILRNYTLESTVSNTVGSTTTILSSSSSTINDHEEALTAMEISSSTRTHHQSSNIHHPSSTVVSLSSSVSSAVSSSSSSLIWTPPETSSISSASLLTPISVLPEYGYLTLRHPKNYKHIDLPKDLSSSTIIPTVFSLVQDPSPVKCRLVLIDFGLAAGSGGNEERGVDLYVLERALLSTHADIAKTFFQSILDHYYAAVPEKILSVIRSKFEQVRMRGRKRLAFG